jgi:hypothetical protein
VHGAFGAVETLALLWFQLLPDLWAFSARLVGPSWAKNEIIVTISFLLFTTVLTSVKELPWSYYYTFVLEEKHGFNKQTRALFVFDLIKSVRSLAPPLSMPRSLTATPLLTRVFAPADPPHDRTATDHRCPSDMDPPQHRPLPGALHVGLCFRTADGCDGRVPHPDRSALQ